MLNKSSMGIAVLGLTVGALAVGMPALAAPGISKSSKPRKSKTTKPAATDSKMPALGFKMKDIDGKEQDLRQYAGKVVLVVNVASKCGFTPQYKGLEALYEKEKTKGFVILGFPANNFGSQEPGPNDKIKEFCTSTYGVTFPMFAKVSVKGSDICDLYKYLTGNSADYKFGGDIQWNFTKFLVNRKGEVIARFKSAVSPEDKKLKSAIEEALAEPASSNAGEQPGKGKSAR